MEIRDLRYFAVIAKHQNIGRAADALELSATALSKSLRRLEKTLGAKLVRRAPKGIALTAIGEALLVRTAPLEGMLNDARNEATDLAQGRAGYVHIGAGMGSPESLVGQACVRFTKASPGVALRVSVDNQDVLGDAMRRGEMDFCVFNAQVFSATEFTCEPLYDDQFVVYASASHHLAKRKQIAFVDLAKERWALVSNSTWHTWLQRACEAHGVSSPAVTLTTNSEAVRALAILNSNCLGISSRQFLRREARKHPLIEIPVKELNDVRRVSIIYRKKAYLSPPARQMMTVIKTLVKEAMNTGYGARGRGN